MKRITTLLLLLQLGLLGGLAQSLVETQVVWKVAYQGTLSTNGVPVNGPHDIIMRLYDAPSGGAQIGAACTNTSVPVTNGQFNALMSCWTSDDFASTNLHVQIALRRTGSGTPFVTLLPRQQLFSVPRAAVAERALTISSNALSPAYLGTNGVDGRIIATGSLSGDKIAAASVVKSINGLKDGVTLEAGEGLTLTATNNTITMWAPHLCSDYAHCYWSLFGNNNIVPNVNFMGGVAGELDPVEFRVNNTHIMRYEVAGYVGSPSTPNIIGGDKNNAILVGRGSVISGGGNAGAPNIMDNGHWGVIAGGVANRITNQYCVIGGGLRNDIHGSANPSSGWYSGIAFGFLNQIASGTGATISGGQNNRVSADNATTAGGAFNTNSGSSSTIGGGRTNRILNLCDSAVIAGGDRNEITGVARWANIGGGHYNTNSAEGATLSGGEYNSIGASAVSSTLGGGAHNRVTGVAAVVAGGIYNDVSGPTSMVGGGGFNVVSGSTSIIGGGSYNVATGDNATIGGGFNNLATTDSSTIPGGSRAKTISYGQQAYASGQFAGIGDAQGSLYVLRTNTSSTAQSELFLDGGFNNQRMNVPVGATWDFSILVAARNGVAGGNQSGGWEIRGVVQNIAGTVSLLCSTITTNCATLVGTPFVQALNPQQALVIKTKDQLAFPTRWVASVRTAEVIAP